MNGSFVYGVTAYLFVTKVNKPQFIRSVTQWYRKNFNFRNPFASQAMDARQRAFVLFANRFLESDEEESDEDSEPDFVDVYDVRSSDDEEETRPTLFGGYDYEFVDKVLDSQTCPVCLLPMRDAVQTTECGHRFCKDCLLGILRYAFCLHILMLVKVFFIVKSL